MATNAIVISAGRSTENDWLFDYIVQFLKSPPWTVPLNNFIDENCMIFDDDEENRFTYTEVHKKFIALMDSLLEKNLAVIGVSEEQFLAACEKGATQEANKLIFGQILAVNDFLTFKKMMVKRNIELNVEVMRALSKVPATTAKPTSQSEEEAQIAAAIRISHEQALLDAVKRQLAGTNAAYPAAAKPAATATASNSKPAAIATAPTAAAIKPLPAAATAKPTLTTDGKSAPAAGASNHDDELKAALAASVMEHDLRNAERAKEQAEIEHAIAMSLALEKMNAEKTAEAESDLTRATRESEEMARLQQQKILDAAKSAQAAATLAEEKSKAEAAAVAAAKAQAQAAADAEAKKQHDAAAAAVAARKAAQAAAAAAEAAKAAAATAAAATAQTPAPTPAAPKGSTPGQAIQIYSASSQMTAAAPAPAPATATNNNTISQKLAAISSPAKQSQSALPPVSAPHVAAGGPQPAPTIVTTTGPSPALSATAAPVVVTPTNQSQSLSSLGGAPKLPGLGSSAAPRNDFSFSAMSARADMLFKTNRDQKQAQKAAEAAATAKSGVSDVELQRRQAFLRAQRDLILQKKKADGEAALKQHYEQQQKGGAGQAAAAKAAAAPAPQPIASAPAAAGSDLHGRLKAEYEANQKRKQAEEAAAKFAVLDAQLRRVEEIQSDKNKRAAAEEQLLVQAEKERQAKLAAFHKALQSQKLDATKTDFRM